MPEFNVKEVRLPELHLPEIKRDEIVRALSGVRLPDADLAKAGRARIKMPAVTLTGADAGKLLAAAAAVARFVRPMPRRGLWLRDPLGGRSGSLVGLIDRPRRRRSGWRLAMGVIVVAAIGSWALLRLPPVRRLVDTASRRARQRIDAMRTTEIGPEAATAAGPSAETAEPSLPETAGFANATEDAAAPPEATADPDGHTRPAATDATPVLEESRSPG